MAEFWVDAPVAAQRMSPSIAGALIAPFAFLGSDQEATSERMFTTISARDIYPIDGHALFDNAYMRGLCDHGFNLGQRGGFRQNRPPDQDE